MTGLAPKGRVCSHPGRVIILPKLFERQFSWPEQLEAIAGLPVLSDLPFPLERNGFFRTARSGQGRAERRGEATLDGEDRSEMIDEEGKGEARARFDFRSVTSETNAMCVCQP